MHKIKILDKISPEGIARFPLDRYEIGTEMAHPDAIILRSYNMLEMALPTSLLTVGRAGAGVNNIPIGGCSERGVVVFNTPGANANAVKELAIAGLLLASRNIVSAIRFADALKGKGTDIPRLVEEGKKQFLGQEILGKTLGVIGLGKVGVMVANSARELGMEVMGFDPFISVESAWGLSRAVTRAEGLDSLLAKADYISIHTPLSDTTRGLLNLEKFVRMKRGMRILNLSRGGIVNNDDLKKAIQKGCVEKYVTDFPDAELLEMDRVICIPHLGASTREAETNCAVMISDQIRDFLENGNIRHSVNFPDCFLEPSSECRLLILNKNIPNMVGQISTVLANADVNIAEMLNKSRGDYAYTMIDVASELSQQVLDDIVMIDGVVKVRFLKHSF